MKQVPIFATVVRGGPLDGATTYYFRPPETRGPVGVGVGPAYREYPVDVKSGIIGVPDDTSVDQTTGNLIDCVPEEERRIIAEEFWLRQLTAEQAWDVAREGIGGWAVIKKLG
jgi:hypothetical protein